MIYTGTIPSKTGKIIPVLQSGRTCESRYNPEIEAEKKVQSYTGEKIALITGVSSGIFIQKLRNSFPKTKILAMEYSEEDIEFLKKNFQDSKIFSDSEIIIFPRKNLHKTLIQNYLPALHGNLKIIENQAWLSEMQGLRDEVILELNTAMEDISADFSVQAHFGKIWQKNILSNLRLCDSECKISIDIDKKAVILGAGPSIDKKIPILCENRNNYFVIATDTAFSICAANKITPDAVLSIDAQNVSTSHFLHKISDKTLFVFDLCASNSAAKKITKNDGQIIFSVSNHPLCKEAQNFRESSFLELDSSGGTVTLAALDFAIKCGFENIEVWGADFSYQGGKPYAKGTYLDSLYNMSSTKLDTAEKTFSKLMFRTELAKIDPQKQTTKVLARYKASFEDYLSKKNADFKNEDDVYYVKNKNTPASHKHKSQLNPFGFSKFIADFKEKLKNFENLSRPEQNRVISVLLPYIAYLRGKNFSTDFDQLFKIAKLLFL